MKYILTTIIISIFCYETNAQDLKLDIVINDKGFNCIAIIADDSVVVDTIAFYAFKVELLDYLILDSTSVAYIFESPIHFQHDKFTKDSKGDWKYSNASGQIAHNPKNMGFIPATMFDSIPHSFKIISEDLISYELGNTKTTIIKDCDEIITGRKSLLRNCREVFRRSQKSKNDEK